MRCPSCTDAEMAPGVRDRGYAYNGVTTVIAGVTGAFCPACGEMVLDAPEAAHVNAAMLKHRAVNMNPPSQSRHGRA